MNCVYYLEEKKNNNRMKLDFLPLLKNWFY
jgi:hypothetical protein